MEFIIEFVFLALLIVVSTAFLGVIATKIAQVFGGKKASNSFAQNQQTKKGWKAVGGRKK